MSAKLLHSILSTLALDGYTSSFSEYPLPLPLPSKFETNFVTPFQSTNRAQFDSLQPLSQVSFSGIPRVDYVYSSDPNPNMFTTDSNNFTSLNHFNSTLEQVDNTNQSSTSLPNLFFLELDGPEHRFDPIRRLLDRIKTIHMMSLFPQYFQPQTISTLTQQQSNNNNNHTTPNINPFRFIRIEDGVFLQLAKYFVLTKNNTSTVELTPSDIDSPSLSTKLSYEDDKTNDQSTIPIPTAINETIVPITIPNDNADPELIPITPNPEELQEQVIDTPIKRTKSKTKSSNSTIKKSTKSTLKSPKIAPKPSSTYHDAYFNLVTTILLKLLNDPSNQQLSFYTITYEEVLPEIHTYFTNLTNQLHEQIRLQMISNPSSALSEIITTILSTSPFNAHEIPIQNNDEGFPIYTFHVIPSILTTTKKYKSHYQYIEEYFHQVSLYKTNYFPHLYPNLQSISLPITYAVPKSIYSNLNNNSISLFEVDLLEIFAHIAYCNQNINTSNSILYYNSTITDQIENRENEQQNSTTTPTDDLTSTNPSSISTSCVTPSTNLPNTNQSPITTVSTLNNIQFEWHEVIELISQRIDLAYSFLHQQSNLFWIRDHHVDPRLFLKQLLFIFTTIFKIKIIFYELINHFPMKFQSLSSDVIMKSMSFDSTQSFFCLHLVLYQDKQQQYRIGMISMNTVDQQLHLWIPSWLSLPNPIDDEQQQTTQLQQKPIDNNNIDVSLSDEPINDDFIPQFEPILTSTIQSEHPFDIHIKQFYTQFNNIKSISDDQQSIELNISIYHSPTITNSSQLQ